MRLACSLNRLETILKEPKELFSKMGMAFRMEPANC